jgi:hypothetical protein
MGTNGEIRRFRDSRKSGGVLIESVTTTPLRITEPFCEDYVPPQCTGPEL